MKTKESKQMILNSTKWKSIDISISEEKGVVLFLINKC